MASIERPELGTRGRAQFQRIRGGRALRPLLHMRPFLNPTLAFSVALALAGALIAASLIGVSSPRTQSAPPSVQTFLASIPQEGQTLGRRDAPVTLVEYADLQCTLCAQFAVQTALILAHEYVRTGRLRIVLRPVAFIGPDSTLGARAVLAAGLQDRLWNLVQLLYLNQRSENAGWLDAGLILRLAALIPELDEERLQREIDSPRVGELLIRSARQARAAGLTGTPYFAIGRTGGELSVLRVSSLDASAFRPAIERLLQ